MKIRLVSWILLIGGAIGIIIGAVIGSDWVTWGFMIVSVIGATTIICIKRHR